jgi:hypothetical protein
MMAIVWHGIPHVSEHYHPGGSLLVIATGLADAHNMVRRGPKRIETRHLHCETCRRATPHTVEDLWLRCGECGTCWSCGRQSRIPCADCCAWRMQDDPCRVDHA